MIKNLIELTAWEMTPPKAYGTFHLLFMCIGFLLCVLLARRCAKLSEKGHRWLLLCIGLGLTASELYKQLFYYYHIGAGSYQWWIFPFQLCSVPMYLCIAAALLKPGKIRDGLCNFMCTYNMLGGAMAFLEPSGLCHGYWTLTIHAFVWHMLLVFIGLYLIASGRCCKKAADFESATVTFLSLCAVAFSINLLFKKVSGGTINMFFMGPSDNPLIVFKSIAQYCGWYVATALYIPTVCFGAWLIYLGISAYHRKNSALIAANSTLIGGQK
ncbi:MAG: YwaF family protein [Oscillospiraceae bacterium]|nr:YwaF family protein [Oscillospiraceae bacterium]